ncbi:isoprenylcysteine alpha-carbonyl methylesterase ICME-like isoform X2 [Cucumis melo var. makuwa]|uniref:protein-S-isoprenylcysteine alpha-carbonyl methylesterase n=1 Tax=Cucumis melo var. makuwa TaxID=1194695 RepID=A0A5D3B6T6_CUCMM|nr:isoprenylcysteine alpha-carbonyl methylesterase ICME-like isoform X2 [Cucumis melo var. makuwa]
MSDMIKDVSEGISFVFNNIAEYGGDINRIYLMGQSAGAHITACALVEQAIKEAGGEKVSWCVSRIKAYFGLSGGIMEGEESLQRFSPEVMVQDPKIEDAVSLLPHFILFHGTADYSIPLDSCKSFAEVLERIGVKVETVLYKGKTHTDLFVQDPMRGGKDQLVEDLIFVIHENDRDAFARNPMARQRRRLVPELLLKLACTVSPF